MKRIGYLYEKIYDIENVKLAIKNASKGKLDRSYVQKILTNIDYYANEISEALKNKTYKLSQNHHRVIKDESSQKKREITIPKFYPDLIIQWAVIQVLKSVFSKGMYEYSCGSVPGRGGLYAKKYIEKVQHRKGARYILKLDIRKFFPSASNSKLKELLRKKIKDNDCLELLDAIINNGGDGMPIGYYTSQWFSNFYLQELDHFIKEKLHIKYYVRYADDMVLIDSNKRKLHKARKLIAEFLLARNFKIVLKNNWQLWRIFSRPLDFVGYRFYQTHTNLRKKIFYRLSKVIRRIKNYGINIRRTRRFTSLLGWAAHSNFKNYYLKYIKTIISKKTAGKYISVYDKFTYCTA